jgi:hypothetical protein
VPLDGDILDTHAHEAAASSRLGHKWVPYGYWAL